MNWRILKEFCNNLPENELDKNVILWRESEGIDKIGAEQLIADHYVDPNKIEKGCLTEGEAKSLIKDKDNFPNGMDDLEKVYDKGTPILYEDI